MRKLEKKKGRYIWAGAAILILMVAAGVFGLSLHAQVRAVPVNPIDGLNTGRSQELIVGTGFSMDKKQQQIHKKEEKIRKAQQQKLEQKVAASSPRQVHKEGGGRSSPENGDSGGPNTDAGETEEGDAEKPDETEEPQQQEDPTLPEIKTSLKQNEEVSGAKGFWVKASDYKGRYIGAEGLTVTVNGTRLRSSGDSGTRVNYNARDLKDGTNTIQITAEDTYGKSRTVVYVIRGDSEKEAEVEGTILLSVEAHTIGKGYILGPKEVEVLSGQPFPYTLDKLLKENGLDYDSSGTLNSGFYLSRIYKPGITEGWKIPDALLKHAEESGVSVETASLQSGSLGAGDFTKHAGWMYQVNGEVLESGMSGYIPTNGDEVRIRFTLYFGYDLGGSWGDYPED